jgi:hypothetical protein
MDPYRELKGLELKKRERANYKAPRNKNQLPIKS